MAKKALTRRDFLTCTAATGVIAALGLSGCSSDDNDDDADSTSSDDEPKTEDEQPEPAEPVVLSAAIAASATDVSPVGANSALSLAGAWHVFEGLYDLDLHTYKPYEALAAGDPVRISDIEYEVTLRENAMFSNGAAVNANDVVTSFERNMANTTYADFLGFINSVIAKDETTVTFILNYPFPTLLKKRLSVVKIFPADQTDEDLQTHPIGSGPWKYDEIDIADGGLVRFAKNEYYNAGHPAACDAMEWNVRLDADSRATELIDGDVLAIDDVNDDSIDDIIDAGATVEYVPGFALPFLMFNTKKEPFNDRRVRQAFFYAIDTDKLIANEMGGHATPATSLLPETHANYHRSSNVYSFDADKASALLEEAGQSGLSLELTVNSSWVNDLAPQIQENLEAVGINVTLNETIVDWTALDDSEEVLPYDVILSPGDPSCFGNDPDLLMTWWYGDNVWTSGRTCWKGSEAWTSLQDLLQQARELPDNDERQDIWNQCLDIIAEEVPLYPLFHRDVTTAYWADKLEGFSPISTTGLMFLGVTPYK